MLQLIFPVDSRQTELETLLVTFFRKYFGVLPKFSSLPTQKMHFSTREEKFRISKRPCNVLFIYINASEVTNFPWERRGLLCNHRNVFPCVCAKARLVVRLHIIQDYLCLLLSPCYNLA